MKKKKVILGMLITVFAVLAGIYIAGVFYYQKHFFPQTSINEIEVSGKTLEEVSQDIISQLESYVLTITGRNQITDQIASNDIDMKIDLGEQISDALQKQNEWLWPISILEHKKYTIKGDIYYSEDKLNQKISSMNCQENAKAPEDAYISEYISGDGFSIIPEQENNLLKKEVFKTMVKESLISLDCEITLNELESADAYEHPEVCSDDKNLKKLVKKMNQLTQALVTYDFGGKQEIVDGTDISQWLDIDKKEVDVTLNEDKVREFVNSLAKTYDTYNGNGVRDFQTSYGQTVKIQGGNYGWWMDRQSTTQELIEAVKKGRKTVLSPVYYQKAANYGENDYGNSYVEINLTAQHLFLYKDGKKILETDFVSGKPSVKNSPSGVYAVTYKERAHTMKGSASDPYRVETSFWMPFAGHVGMHDAMWRKAFGGTIYKNNGSHGCINLPYNAARTIYENVEKGFPVICYRLNGTEHSKTTAQSDEEIANIGIDAIDRIGNVTRSNYQAVKKKIEWARQVYTDLSSSQKKYVTNYHVLTEAERILKSLR